ncbi:hypothetical protein [Bosea sp. (in: a-proteobacteria)]
MREPELKRVVIDITTSNICDSISRVLADVQRFGWALNEIAAVTSPTGTTVIKLALSAPSHLEGTHIENRLARHPSIVNVRARLVSGDCR